MSQERLAQIKKKLENVTQGEWGPYSANIPFYAIMKKPAPSLSKHEGTKIGEQMWRIPDAMFVATAVVDMQFLIHELEIKQQELNQIREVTADWNERWSKFTPMNAAKNARIFALQDALKDLTELVDKSLCLDDDLGMAWDDLHMGVLKARSVLDGDG